MCFLVQVFLKHKMKFLSRSLDGNVASNISTFYAFHILTKRVLRRSSPVQCYKLFKSLLFKGHRGASLLCLQMKACGLGMFSIFFILTKGKMNLENLSILSEYLKLQNIKFRWRMLAI